MMKFEYYEVRPVLETKNGCTSYRCEEEYESALELIATTGQSFETYWSLYGICASDTPSVCVGDFASKDAAHEVMNAIIGERI